MLMPVLPCAPTALFSGEDLLQAAIFINTISSTSKDSSGMPNRKRKKLSLFLFVCFFSVSFYQGD